MMPVTEIPVTDTRLSGIQVRESKGRHGDEIQTYLDSDELILL